MDMKQVQVPFHTLPYPFVPFCTFLYPFVLFRTLYSSQPLPEEGPAGEAAHGPVVHVLGRRLVADLALVYRGEEMDLGVWPEGGHGPLVS